MAGTKRKPTAEEAREAREEKLTAAQQQITDYVENLSSGADWKNWLDTAKKFPNYSFNNRVLISQQRPDASLVQGYRAWQDMDRQVRKGERGITILGPRMGITGWRWPDGTTTQTTGQVSKTDVPEGATPVRSMVGVTPLTVFDVSQTDGEPLPAKPVPEPVSLDGPAPEGMRDGLEQIITEHGFSLHRDPALAAEDGYTNFANNTINISPGQSGAQEALTLAHEVGHMLMHDPEQRSSDEPRLHRGIAEVEAESVAYLVADHAGIDTKDNSFPYVTNWAGTENPHETVKTTAEKVITTAEQIIDRIEPQHAEDEAAPELLHRAETTRDAAETINEPHTQPKPNEPAPNTATNRTRPQNATNPPNQRNSPCSVAPHPSPKP